MHRVIPRIISNVTLINTSDFNTPTVREALKCVPRPQHAVLLHLANCDDETPSRGHWWADSWQAKNAWLARTVVVAIGSARHYPREHKPKKPYARLGWGYLQDRLEALVGTLAHEFQHVRQYDEGRTDSMTPREREVEAHDAARKAIRTWRSR